MKIIFKFILVIFCIYPQLKAFSLCLTTSFFNLPTDSIEQVSDYVRCIDEAESFFNGDSLGFATELCGLRNYMLQGANINYAIQANCDTLNRVSQSSLNQTSILYNLCMRVNSLESSRLSNQDQVNEITDTIVSLQDRFRDVCDPGNNGCQLPFMGSMGSTENEITCQDQNRQTICRNLSRQLIDSHLSLSNKLLENSPMLLFENIIIHPIPNFIQSATQHQAITQGILQLNEEEKNRAIQRLRDMASYNTSNCSFNSDNLDCMRAFAAGNILHSVMNQSTGFGSGSPGMGFGMGFGN
jgi:hypothetical protein